MALQQSQRATLLPPAEGFGALLRSWRELRGLSNSHLASRIGCDHSTVSRWEHGSRIPDRRNALALANALHLTGAHRATFLSHCGYIERPLTDAQASYLAGWRDGDTGRYNAE
jgi:transcriptional regulator with XRE-family HTH domain